MIFGSGSPVLSGCAAGLRATTGSGRAVSGAERLGSLSHFPGRSETTVSTPASISQASVSSASWRDHLATPISLVMDCRTDRKRVGMGKSSVGRGDLGDRRLKQKKNKY